MTRRVGERGSGVIEAMLVIVFVMAFVVGAANLSVQMYQKGAVHTAVDQGARVGALDPGDGVAACEARIRQVLSNILSGPSGAGAMVGCGDDGEVVTATVRLSLVGWVPGIPAANVDATGVSRKERAP